MSRAWFSAPLRRALAAVRRGTRQAPALPPDQLQHMDGDRLAEVAAERARTLEPQLEDGGRAEEALRRERDRAQRYLDTVQTIIVALDAEGRITAINRRGCEAFGCGEDELIGQSWFAACLPQPEGMETVYPVFLRMMAGDLEPVEYFENAILTRRGERRQIAWHNALLRDDHGQVAGTLSSGQDITERKRAEAEAAAHHEEMVRWYNVTLGRENRVRELKHEVNELLAAAGRPPRYPSAM